MTGKSHMPPVPPANRTPQGGSESTNHSDIAGDKAAGVKDATDRNLASQGRQGNIKTNTTNQGHQQDR